MSNWTWKHRGAPRPKATPITIASIALLLMLAFVSGRGAGVMAQLEPVASPAASPTTGECTPPSGEVDLVGTPAAAGTPEPLTGTPVSASEEEAVLAAAQNFVSCYNAGDFETLAQLVTPNLLLDLIGIEDPSTAVEMLEVMDLPPITLLGVGEVESFDDGRVGLDVQYLLGEYQVVSATHYFVEEDGVYLLDEEAYEAPRIEGDSVLIGVSVSDETDSFAFDQGADELGNRTIPPMDIINVFGTNGSSNQQIFEMYALIGGSEATPVSEGLPDSAELVGRLSLAPGEAATMALVDLPVGAYGLLIAGETGTGVTLFVAPTAE